MDPDVTADYIGDPDVRGDSDLIGPLCTSYSVVRGNFMGVFKTHNVVILLKCLETPALEHMRGMAYLDVG